MNGFADHGLDENAFGEKKGFSEGIRSFDAFRKIPINPLTFLTLLTYLFCVDCTMNLLYVKCASC